MRDLRLVDQLVAVGSDDVPGQIIQLEVLRFPGLCILLVADCSDLPVHQSFGFDLRFNVCVLLILSDRGTDGFNLLGIII